MARFAFLASVCLLVSASAARSTVVEPMTFEQLIQRAERVFVGQVIAAEPFLDRGTIRTRVTFRVTETLKGQTSATVQLVFRGGQVGDMSLEIDGMPAFAVGEEQVIFASDQSGLVSPIVGFWHGQVRISREPTTGRARILRHDRTPVSQATALTQSPPSVSDQVIVPMPLEAFLDAVRQVVRREGGAR